MTLRDCLLGAAFAIALVPLSSAHAADSAKGATLFKQRCAVCHSLEPGKTGLGPNLKGVVGRKAGSATFAYSSGLKASGLAWTAPNLDKFLKAPSAMVPGTFMAISVPNDADRQDIVAFLGTQK